MTVMRHPRFENKFRFLSFLMWFVLLVLATRLFYLQVIHGTYYKILSRNNYSRKVILRSPRGIIKDRNGVVLARNEPSFMLVLDTHASGRSDAVANAKKLLGMDIEKAETRAVNSGTTAPGLAIVARDVPIEVVEKVEANRSLLGPLHVEMELRREYPFGKLASHAIGYVGFISSEKKKESGKELWDPFKLEGKSGVEKTANKILSGRNGFRSIQVDSHGREVTDPSLRVPYLGHTKEPVPGRPVTLTIDMKLQAILEKAFGAETGSAVFMNPETGEILAWVSRPNYDPNLFSGGIGRRAWVEISRDPRHPLLDRPIQGAYPPGSTFKPFVALVGLLDGKLTKNTVFFCPGFWRFGKRVFHCWRVHGAVNLETAIQNSCNVYFYHAADRIGIDDLARWGKVVGFGAPTGVDLPGERSGVMPDPAWKRRHKLGPWVPGDTIPIGIGQGYLTVTPLQLLSFYSTLAAGGLRYKPHVLKGPPQLISRIDIPPSVLSVVREGLWRVVNAGGTGGACAIPGLNVCAKTGTAQVVRASAGRNTMSLAKKIRDHAWFAGFAPEDHPRVAFVVMVEHGGHGGGLGARIAKAGLKYLFPDRNPLSKRKKTPGATTASESGGGPVSADPKAASVGHKP